MESKKDVFKFLSVNNMVIPPAKTGKDNNKSIAVINTDHTNRDILSTPYPGKRMFFIVQMKFIAPSIEDTPAKCSENIAKSTDAPGCPLIEDNGG